MLFLGCCQRRLLVPRTVDFGNERLDVVVISYHCLHPPTKTDCHVRDFRCHFNYEQRMIDVWSQELAILSGNAFLWKIPKVLQKSARTHHLLCFFVVGHITLFTFHLVLRALDHGPAAEEKNTIEDYLDYLRRLMHLHQIFDVRCFDTIQCIFSFKKRWFSNFQIPLNFLLFFLNVVGIDGSQCGFTFQKCSLNCFQIPLNCSLFIHNKLVFFIPNKCAEVVRTLTFGCHLA